MTLLTANRFVRRGIRRDLCQWRERDWRWERFGQLVPIRDLDLWQRVDRALAIHQVECLAWHCRGCRTWTGRLSDQSVGDHCSLISSCDESTAVIEPRPRVDLPDVSPTAAGPFAAGRRLTAWGQEVLNSLAGLGQPALSRTA